MHLYLLCTNVKTKELFQINKKKVTIIQSEKQFTAKIVRRIFLVVSLENSSKTNNIVLVCSKLPPALKLKMCTMFA